MKPPIHEFVFYGLHLTGWPATAVYVGGLLLIFGIGYLWGRQ